MEGPGPAPDANERLPRNIRGEDGFHASFRRKTSTSSAEALVSRCPHYTRLRGGRKGGIGRVSYDVKPGTARDMNACEKKLFQKKR